MKGNLVIAGGNIKNNIIYEEFVRLAGGETARIAIVPTAANDTAEALSELNCSDYIEYRNSPELEEIGVLLIMQGLGFFKHGIIDQHFEERRRLGRLVEALFAVKLGRGFGISEDTAMVYNIEKKKMKIIGTGRVTVVDISMGRSNIKTTLLVVDDTYYI